MIFEAGNVVVVLFPFTDRKASKRRPALVLSDASAFNAGHSVLAIITSNGRANWPLDVPIQDAPTAGLSAPSVVRMKVFTLDNRLILRRAGTLAGNDAKAVAASMKQLLGRSLNL